MSGMETTERTTWLIRRADDALVLGHRLSEWCGHAPMLEEDLALANIALDQIGVARAFYQATAEALGSDEDRLAYHRSERDYLNLLLVEQPNGDFARTIVRQLLFSAAMVPFWRGCAEGTDAAIAAVAAKAEKEAAYHLRHAAEWTVRLGDGTEESRRRTEAALAWLWPFTDELFEADAVEQAMIGAGAVPDPAVVRPAWEATMETVLARATLSRPEPGWPRSGGRAGRHGEEFGHLLSELQYLQRAHPGATW